MVHVQFPTSLRRYLWSVVLAALSLIILRGSLFSQTIVPAATSITLSITVINDNGGQASSTNFQAQFDGNNVDWNTPIGVSAGTYSAGVNNPPVGYSTSGWDGACATNGSVTIADGENLTCSITYDDVAPTLTLVKVLPNNSGGTAQINDFQAKIDNNNVAWNMPIELNAGDYTVSETNLPGYQASDWSGDCNANGGVTLSPGDNATCSITNDDIAPTLRLVKMVVNNNGGTATVSSFQAKINGNNVAWNTNIPLTAGTYTASETGLTGYTASNWSGDCQPDGKITLALDQTAECTITNDDIAPTLKLIKIVQNTHGGTATASSFQAKIDNNNVSWNIAVTLNAGNHTATESSLPGYTASSWSGDCAPNGTITLTPGQTAECTITNSDTPAQLKLVKTVQNNYGGTATASDFQAKIDNTNVAWNTFIPLSAGDHTASETSLAGYTTLGWGGDCKPNGGITLALGQSAVCTITNNDIAGTLKLVKTVTNDNGGTATAANFQAKIDNAAVAWDTAIPVAAGQHTASEVNLSGYLASVWGGDCAANGQVAVALGENKVCTITNDDAPATLIVIKKVINDHGGTLTAGQFNLKVTGSNPSPATFVGSETGTNVALHPGAYSVSETPPSGYAVSYSAECSGTIALGETKTCTVTNDDIPARLRVIKEVINDNGGTLTVSDFALFIDGIPVTSGTFISVTAGLHTVSETPNLRYAATYSTSCAGGQTILTLGQQRTCRITNNDKPLGITILKTANSASVQPGTPVIYSYSVGNTATVPLNNITVLDDKCTPVQPINSGPTNSGDSNQDNILDPGEDWQYTCTATLFVDTLNTATAQGTPVGGGLPVSDSSQVTVDVRANIQVTNTASTLTAPPTGGLVNFTVKVRNLSQGDQVTIQNLQNDLYGNITDPNNPKLQATNCVTPRNLAVGVTYTCTFSVLVSGALDEQISNTVLATGTDDDGQPVSGNASAAVTISGSVLQPTKVAVVVEDADQNGVASPGDTLEYTVVMQNKGNEQAAGIVFQDTPDANTTLVVGSVQTSRGTVELGNGANQTTVKVTVGTINPNATVTVRFRVKVNDPLPSNVAQVKNQGSISGQTTPQTLTDDPNTLEVGDATITSLTLAPLVKAVKTVQLVTDQDNTGTATAGDTLEYAITISNQGVRTANGVVLNDAIEAQTLALVVGTVQTTLGTVSKGNQPGDGAVQITVGDLAGGSDARITFQVTVKNPLPAGVAQVSNQGFISGSNFPTTGSDDPNTPANNDPTRTQVTNGPLLDATKLATLGSDNDQNGQPGPGDILHYQVRIINSGNAAASAVAFADPLDVNTTLIVGSVTTTQGAITRGNSAGDDDIAVTLNDISAGGEVVIAYKAQINSPLAPTVVKVANQGVVTSQTLPPVLTDDPTTPAVDDPTQTQVRILPQLAATKRATLLLDNDNDQVADPGDTLLYEVALSNNGNATASAVTFVDTVDSNTTLVANAVQSSQGTVQSGNNAGDTQVRVEIGNLAGGAGATISYQATIKNPLPAQTVEVVNQGTVQSKELDPVITDDPATGAAGDATRTQVVASARLQVLKQDLLWIDADDDRQVTLGDQLLYQIKIINTGNVAATNVLLQDTVDPHTVLVNNSVQSSQGSVQQGNGASDSSVVIALGAIPPNGVVNIGFRVRVNVNENGQLSNQATVTHDQPAPSGAQAQPIQLVSDDPDTAESGDPTLTPIVRKGSGQDSGGQRIYMPNIRRVR